MQVKVKTAQEQKTSWLKNDNCQTQKDSPSNFIFGIYKKVSWSDQNLAKRTEQIKVTSVTVM